MGRGLNSPEASSVLCACDCRTAQYSTVLASVLIVLAKITLQYIYVPTFNLNHVQFIPVNSYKFPFLKNFSDNFATSLTTGLLSLFLFFLFSFSDLSSSYTSSLHFKKCDSEQATWLPFKEPIRCFMNRF